jgi:hypothetical protein
MKNLERTQRQRQRQVYQRGRHLAWEVSAKASGTAMIEKRQEGIEGRGEIPRSVPTYKRRGSRP